MRSPIHHAHGPMSASDSTGSRARGGMPSCTDRLSNGLRAVPRRVPMPEMHYRLRWPDETEMTCYSPSLVIRDYFEPGADYALAEFLRRVREATHIASERVREKFGYACSRAHDQL